MTATKSPISLDPMIVSDGAPWRITWAFVQTGCTIVLLANVKPVIAAGASSGATNRNRVTGKKIADVVPQNSSDHSIFSLSRPLPESWNGKLQEGRHEVSQSFPCAGPSTRIPFVASISAVPRYIVSAEIICRDRPNPFWGIAF